MCILRFVASSFVHPYSMCHRLSRYTHTFCLHYLWICGCFTVQTCRATAIGIRHNICTLKCFHVAVIVCHRFARIAKLLKRMRYTYVVRMVDCAYTLSAIFQKFIYRRYNTQTNEMENDRETKCETLEIASFKLYRP